MLDYYKLYNKRPVNYGLDFNLNIDSLPTPTIPGTNIPLWLQDIDLTENLDPKYLKPKITPVDNTDNFNIGYVGAGLQGLTSGMNNYFAVDSSPVEAQLEAEKQNPFTAWDNSSLMSQLNTWTPSKTNYTMKDMGFDWGEQLGNIGSAAVGGLSAGGIGAAISGGLAAIGSIGAGIKAWNEAKDMNAKGKQNNILAQNNFFNQVNAVEYSNDRLNKLNSFAEGGMMNLPEGLSFINEGGTHEQNPFGGVPMGVAEDGSQNLVEEGEVIYNDYVFSNRLEVPKELKDKYSIKDKSITFADAVKRLLKPYEDNTEDSINKRGIEVLMSDFTEVQEQVRAEKNIKNKNIKWGGGHNRMKPLEHLYPITSLDLLPENMTVAEFINVYYPSGTSGFLSDAEASGLTENQQFQLKNILFKSSIRDYISKYFKIEEDPHDLGSAGRLYNIPDSIINQSLQLMTGAILPTDKKIISDEDITNIRTVAKSLGYEEADTDDILNVAEFVANASMDTEIEEISTYGDLRGAGKLFNTVISPYIDLWTNEEIAESKEKAVGRKEIWEEFKEDAQNAISEKVTQAKQWARNTIDSIKLNQQAKKDAKEFNPQIKALSQNPYIYSDDTFTDLEDITPTDLSVKENIQEAPVKLPVGYDPNMVLGTTNPEVSSYGFTPISESLNYSEVTEEPINVTPYFTLVGAPVRTGNKMMTSPSLEGVKIVPTSRYNFNQSPDYFDAEDYKEAFTSIIPRTPVHNYRKITLGDDFFNLNGMPLFDHSSNFSARTGYNGSGGAGGNGNEKGFEEETFVENAYTDVIQDVIKENERNKQRGIVAPVEQPPKHDIHNTTLPINQVTYPINNDNMARTKKDKSYTDSDINKALKWVPMATNAAALLQNIFTNPDYEYANKIESAAKRLPSIKPTLISGKVPYTPHDINYLLAKQIASSNAARQGVLNTANNAGAARAATLTSDNALINALGETYFKGLEANEAKRLQALQHNLGIDQYNAQAIDKANTINAELEKAYQESYLRNLMTAASLRREEDSSRAASIGANTKALAENAYQLYRDEITDRQVDFYNTFGRYLNEEGRKLAEEYKKAGLFGKDGGKLNKRTKKRKGLTY